MKKHLLSLTIALAAGLAGFGQTATDFTATDCAGVSHHLFAELNAGKVIVMVWVMPCGTCIGPAQTAFYAAQSFQGSYPGRVLYYLVDDANNTACSSLTAWASTNSISPNSTFKSPVILMSDYTGSGMPKVVVLGGSAHTVFDDENDVFVSGTLTTAITNALAAQSEIGVIENAAANFQFSLFPAPVKNNAKISYVLSQNDDVSYEIYNVMGEKVQSVVKEKQNAGKHEISIDMETLPEGIYFMRLKVGNNEEVKKFSISK